MQLCYINIPALLSEAGGNPWEVAESLQAGRPAQIAALGQAFRDAGRCTSEAAAAFDEARRRFWASWNRGNGEHPIDDATEVQRVVESLGLQSAQLPRIGVDLENIAATLAEAQRAAGCYITALEYDLDNIDREIGEALGDA
ncbi:MAG: hypothetical protein PHQ28_05460, partial [Mycobacterium sp.]|nr:hypothetical protein [Mycobacterium sp.]